MENTLLIGNGFTRSLYKNPTDWGGLFDDAELKEYIQNYTLLYEACRLKEDLSDNFFKRKIADKLREGSFPEDLKKPQEVSEFGKKLKEKNVKNILTTNTDFSIKLKK